MVYHHITLQNFGRHPVLNMAGTEYDPATKVLGKGMDDPDQRTIPGTL